MIPINDNKPLVKSTYISDFLGLAGLPAALCRPSAAELATGVSRTPQIILPYKRLTAIFRVAHSIYDPTKFDIEDGNEEENLYEEMERRIAEVRKEERIKMERRVAEKRKEIRIEMERLAAEMERRVAAEIERRKAEGRLEAE